VIESQQARLTRQSITYLILLAGALVMFFPLLWTVSTSLKTPDKVTLRHIELIPDPWAFQNYLEIFFDQPLLRYTRNTMILVGAAVFGALVPCSLAAWGFARIPFPGRRTLFALLLTTMMLPYVVQLIPLFIVFDRMGWVNTFWPLILPRVLGHNAFYIFLMRQFFRGIPVDLFDAARIDGASEFGVWWRIAMPMSLPVLAAVSIFAFQFAWDDFLWPLIYLGGNKQNWTLAMGLNALKGFEGDENTMNVMMTFSTLMLMPMLLVFYFGQKYLVKGVSVAGLKG
jgi:ABC-type glycerol-3-phosphate transport system permease component